MQCAGSSSTTGTHDDRASSGVDSRLTHIFLNFASIRAWQEQNEKPRAPAGFFCLAAAMTKQPPENSGVHRQIRSQ